MPGIAELKLTFDHSINYAFQQNAIPVVQELWLRNDATPRHNLVIRITTEPSFAAPVELHIQALGADEEFRVAPLDLKLSPSFLAELPERVSGLLKVEVVEGVVVLHSRSESIALLARNEWCGLVSLPEILAAFVLPNDPTVMTILGRAAELLREHTGRAAFNGYQDKSRKRAWEQAAAIYRAIGELGLRYISPPASFETTGQKVRFPTDIVAQRFGTCLDLALLFASCCEQAGLRPLVLIHEGHAYAGCWLEEQTLPEPATDDLQHIRKLKASDLLMVFEATMLADEEPGMIGDAELLALAHLETTKPFRLCLDVHRARIARIRPLPIPGAAPIAASSLESIAPTMLGLGARDFLEPTAAAPQIPAKAATRIDQWKSRLLDLSLRNRLLNLKETKATIRVLSAAPEHVEDELAAERELALLPRPKMLSEDDPRNAVSLTKQERADALAEHLRDELSHKRLHSNLEEQEHAKRLTELFRSARNAIDENGTNTLFAAVGLLEWRETEHSERILRAPILLVPVELKRKSVLEGFSLRRIDEETRLNVTLMEMLRQHFRKEIAGLDPLPEDDQGVDVGRVFQIFRDAVRELSGWEVKTEIWLGQFSFTKFLLWKDLADRIEDLTRNRIVRHLVEEAGAQYPNAPDDIRPDTLDERFHPKDVYCPRSADSSQLAAVMAAAAGHDFVLEGPPGTGKSQTITNIIAHCLARGKRVLFVAEKRAALDVVHRRLREDGLEPFCLELHSNKTGKADVLAQFDKALKFAAQATTDDWTRRATELESARNTLNHYTASLHVNYPCGLSPYRCIDYLLPRRDKSTVRLDGWAPILGTSEEKLTRAREVAHALRERSRSLAPVATNPLAPIAFEDWSPSWGEEALEALNLLRNATKTAIDATGRLRELLKCRSAHSTRGELHRLRELAESLLSAETVGPDFFTSPWKQLSSEIDRWADRATERAKLRTDLAQHHASKGDDHGTLVCESWATDECSRVVEACRAMELLARASDVATRELLTWLNAPSPTCGKAELVPLSALAECLLAAPAVGPAFATTPWTEWLTEFDRWIALVREREELRTKIVGYNEADLLRLDLGALAEKWKQAPKSWFLLRILRTGSVTRALRSARSDRNPPAAETIEPLLAAATRLHTITSELASMGPRATSFLGQCWRGGEPSSEELARVRQWGVQLHERLGAVASSDAAWVVRIRERLALQFQSGPTSLAPGSLDGDRLLRFREATIKLLAAYPQLVSEAALLVDQLERSGNFAGDIVATLRLVQRGFTRVSQINDEMRTSAATARASLGDLWRSGEPSAEVIRRARVWGDVFHARLVDCAGTDVEWLAELRLYLSRLFAEGPATYSSESTFAQVLQRFVESHRAFDRALDATATKLHLRREAIDAAPDHLESVSAATSSIADAWPKVREWCAWQRTRREAIELGLAPVVAAIEADDSAQVDAAELFERSFRKALLFAAIESQPSLRNFLGREHGERIDRFRQLDEVLQKLARDIIRARLAGEIPREQNHGDIPKQEMALLRKELGKKTRHIPVRKLIGGIQTLLPRLKPCVLMSPLSVAQYLDAGQSAFDVVVFDEASQIPVWDAVGAIARGSQLIVVGDPKQLPPTNFFNSTDDEDDDFTPSEFKDLESILDELLTNGLRHKRLQWHYRSRHEGLISFSNRQYYENDLLTFPSPDAEHGGVRFRHLPTARYDKGKSRTNKGEAEALVAELVSRLRASDGPTRSYGVVTFSQAQQSLIENLLDEERRKFPEIEVHFGEAPPLEGEPVFVKNLENVQGDERDVILFSICYGPDEAGKVSMNFGPLNREGGERRLNVAVTRAKHEVIVFSGLRADQIDLSRTRAKGLRDLKLFLDYAERGPRALAASATARPGAEAESEFERLVADRIRAAGFEVHHQVGCSDYRIDLAVVDPAAPGRYLLGVECDGATYHRAATARDRDKLRQAILEGLGWKLHRVWSTDWWHDPQAETAKLLVRLRELHPAGSS